MAKKQWYEENPDILEEEKTEMKDFLGEKAELIFGVVGTVAWRISFCPEILDGNKRQKAGCEKEYDIVIVYEDDYPNTPEMWSNVKVYGTKAFFLMPTIYELSQIVRERYPRNCALPHLLRCNNGLYPTSFVGPYVAPPYVVNRERASAVETTKIAFNWISVFETGMINSHVWELFTRLEPGI